MLLYVSPELKVLEYLQTELIQSRYVNSGGPSLKLVFGICSCEI